ncbi:hypothetical protein HK100_001273 [Physocladia obscura]|uniref:Uncharacterized protein n=1 Tax=Physocladia obscura TaxID=109957 RepID=A0AAD5XBY8_9FUNG|nr:hypothetical protein HK100_001273 [Physocladia obscura]
MTMSSQTLIITLLFLSNSISSQKILTTAILAKIISSGLKAVTFVSEDAFLSSISDNDDEFDEDLLNMTSLRLDSHDVGACSAIFDAYWFGNEDIHNGEGRGKVGGLVTAADRSSINNSDHKVNFGDLFAVMNGGVDGFELDDIPPFRSENRSYNGKDSGDKNADKEEEEDGILSWTVGLNLFIEWFETVFKVSYFPTALNSTNLQVFDDKIAYSLDESFEDSIISTGILSNHTNETIYITTSTITPLQIESLVFKDISSCTVIIHISPTCTLKTIAVTNTHSTRIICTATVAESITFTNCTQINASFTACKSLAFTNLAMPNTHATTTESQLNINCFTRPVIHVAHGTNIFLGPCDVWYKGLATNISQFLTEQQQQQHATKTKNAVTFDVSQPIELDQNKWDKPIVIKTAVAQHAAKAEIGESAVMLVHPKNFFPLELPFNRDSVTPVDGAFFKIYEAETAIGPERTDFNEYLMWVRVCVDRVCEIQKIVVENCTFSGAQGQEVDDDGIDVEKLQENFEAEFHEWLAEHREYSEYSRV